MSILIKGMGMPDSCFHCKLADVCQHYKAEHYANKRHEDCPLEEVPETHEKRTETHACDCISRKAAIDAHYEYCNKHPDAGFPVWSLKILEDLPSAQPEPCEDAVSRQAVYNVLDKMPVRGFKKDGETIHGLISLSQVNSAIIDLPSAQPEIIRCKECKYGDTFHEFDDPEMPMKCIGQHYGGTYPDDFCSYAERRTDSDGRNQMADTSGPS